MSPIATILRRHISAAAITLLAALVVPAASARTPGKSDVGICFPEAAPVIRDCIAGRFAQFWRDNGGLPVFGYPITAARMELNRDTGETYLTQYFERQRLELHPENGRPYDVLLGRLGAVWLEQQNSAGYKFNAGDKGSPALPHFVPETGYNIGFKLNRINPEGGWYWDYYSSHGLQFDGAPGIQDVESLALIGHPLSAVTLQMTTETSFQVFERTILRYQGSKYAKDPEWRIVGDRLGVWYLKYVLHEDNENRLSYP